MNEHSTAGHDNFGYDAGYAQTYDGDYDDNYDRVTARDIADLLHHLAEMRCSTRDGLDNVIDPTERAAFLSRKAELFTRIAEDAEQTGVDDYSRQVRQMTTDARTAAEQASTTSTTTPCRQGPRARCRHSKRRHDHPGEGRDGSWVTTAWSAVMRSRRAPQTRLQRANTDGSPIA